MTTLLAGADTAAWDRAERFARVGSWGWKPATDELELSKNLFRLVGYEPGEITPSTEWLLERLHPADLSDVRRQLEYARAGGALPQLRFRVLLVDGSVRHMEVVQAVERDARGESRRLAGFARDVSDEHATERARAVAAAVADAISSWDAEHGACRLLSELAGASGAVAAALWVPRGEGLALAAHWREESVERGFARALGERPPVCGVGLAGRAWETGRALAEGPFGAADGPAGLHLAIAVPAREGRQLTALLVLYAAEPLETNERVLAALDAAGEQLGSFLVRRPGLLAPLGLTSRELEVLRLAADGLPAAGIHARLGVSHSTVKSHLEHIYEKLGVSNRVAAVARALREGLIE